MKFESIRVVHIIFGSDDMIHYSVALISCMGLRNLFYGQTQMFSGLSRDNFRVKIKTADLSLPSLSCPLAGKHISILTAIKK